jgi:hypothetical protein
VTGQPLLYYAPWPLDYHATVLRRKAFAFSAAGFDVTYVNGVGLRNPRPASLGKALSVAARRLRGRTESASGDEEVAQVGALVVPPRQIRLVERLNVAWLQRQLGAAAGDWRRTLAWVAYPTPEVVAVLRRSRPAGVVYECFDAFDHTPGAVGVWR